MAIVPTPVANVMTVNVNRNRDAARAELEFDNPNYDCYLLCLSQKYIDTFTSDSDDDFEDGCMMDA